jgi:hypothetical protein
MGGHHITIMNPQASNPLELTHFRTDFLHNYCGINQIASSFEILTALLDDITNHRISSEMLGVNETDLLDAIGDVVAVAVCKTNWQIRNT